MIWYGITQRPIVFTLIFGTPIVTILLLRSAKKRNPVMIPFEKCLYAYREFNPAQEGRIENFKIQFPQYIQGARQLGIEYEPSEIPGARAVIGFTFDEKQMSDNLN